MQEANTFSGGEVAGGGLFLFVMAVIFIFFIVVMWKIFVKAGMPGWASIIPIYNAYILLQIAGKPGWWLILLFIPLVNFIIMIVVVLGIAAHFGKGGGFALGMILLPIIFYPILAFGSAKYQPA
jgi:hypothetical protein